MILTVKVETPVPGAAMAAETLIRLSPTARFTAWLQPEVNASVPDVPLPALVQARLPVRLVPAVPCTV